MSHSPLVADLRRCLGADNVLSAPSELAVYDCDGDTLERRRPGAVVFPRSTRQVAEVVAICQRHDVALVPRGGGTGLAGGCVPTAGGVVLVLTRMNRIVEINRQRPDGRGRGRRGEPAARWCAGRDGAAMGARAIGPGRGHHWRQPVGGIVGGTAAAGSMASDVVALEAVLAGGRVVCLGPTDDPAGLDLAGVLVDSEETLAVVTRVWLRLTADPQDGRTVQPARDDHPAAARSPGRAVDRDRDLFLRCVHCGQCTSTCPTFVELGDENDGPRGRIQLMRRVADGQTELTDRMRRHLDAVPRLPGVRDGLPLGRAVWPADRAVPAGYGEQDDTRLEQRFDWFRELILLRLFPYANRLRRRCAPVRLLQRLGVFRAGRAAGAVQADPRPAGADGHLLPMPVQAGPEAAAVPAGRGTAPGPGGVLRRLRGRRHVSPRPLGHAPRLAAATAATCSSPRGRAAAGRSITTPATAGRARAMADANVAAFDLDRLRRRGGQPRRLRGDDEGVRPALGRRAQDARRRFAEKVRDVNEFLDALGMVAPGGRIEAVATYHDACHLGHAQKIVEPPRRLLAEIPGLVLRDLPESGICCGSAGTLQPEPAGHGRTSWRAASWTTSSRPAPRSCWPPTPAACCRSPARSATASHRLLVMHPMELLDLSYRDEQPAWGE